MEGDVLRGVVRRSRDRNGSEDLVGIQRRPGQDLHAAHRAADNGEKSFDSQPVDQLFLGSHHVLNGDRGKVDRPGVVTCMALGAAGACRAHASTQNIRTDHEKTLCVDRLARPHQGIPPAWFAGERVLFSHILVTGQGMADQNRVVFLCTECAICSVCDFQPLERHAAIQS